MRWIGLFLIILASNMAFAQIDCIVSAYDSQNTIHANVAGCTDIGTFSLGGIYNGQMKTLSFHYPKPWRGTYSSFRIGEKTYCTSSIAKNCTHTDAYVLEYTHLSDESIKTIWDIDDIIITQKITPQSNNSLIAYEIRNNRGLATDVGVRLIIDTMLGENDGAPIYVPSDGLQVVEKQYLGTGLSFEYFKAYNQPDFPSIVATVDIDVKKNFTYPEKIIIADWKNAKEKAYDYYPVGNEIRGDSSVILYYEMGKIQPNDIGQISLGYGSGKAVIDAKDDDFSITELTLDKISGQYCTNQTVNVYVDLLSPQKNIDGSITLLIHDDEKNYLNRSFTTSLDPSKIKTVDFSWSPPAFEGKKSYSVSALFVDESGLESKAQRPNLIIVDPSLCPDEIKKTESFTAFPLIIVLMFLAAVIFLAAIIYIAYLWASQGNIVFEKLVDEDFVRVRVENNTPKKIFDVVIKDSIPQDAEIKVETMDVKRIANTLTWEVGSLDSQQKATLTYWLKKGNAQNNAKLTWRGGSKSLK